MQFPKSKASDIEKSSSLSAAIAGARAAATQFTKKDENLSMVIPNGTPDTVRTDQSTSKSLKEDAMLDTNINERSTNDGTLVSNDMEQSFLPKCEASSSLNKTPAGVETWGTS